MYESLIKISLKMFYYYFNVNHNDVYRLSLKLKLSACGCYTVCRHIEACVIICIIMVFFLYLQFQGLFLTSLYK